MDLFVNRLRNRTRELGLKDVDVARRIGINDRTYAHYAAGRREPNLQTLVKIVAALQTSADHLLGIDQTPKSKLSKKGLQAEQAQSIVCALDGRRARIALAVLRAIEEDMSSD